MAKRKSKRNTASPARLVSVQRREKKIKKIKKAMSAHNNSLSGSNVATWEDLSSPLEQWSKTLKEGLTALVYSRLKAQELGDDEKIEQLAKYAKDLSILNKLFKDVIVMVSGKTGVVAEQDLGTYVEAGTYLYDILMPKLEDIFTILTDISEVYQELKDKETV